MVTFLSRSPITRKGWRWRGRSGIARGALLLSNLGDMAVVQGDYVQAEQYIREGISLAQHLENRNYLTSLLAHLAALSEARGI